MASNSQLEVAPMKDFKCASCHQHLENPVQLPACLHILCLKCEQKLGDVHKHNIFCPMCQKENARLNVLQRISAVTQPSKEIRKCDILEDHDFARWNCFDCGKNLCGFCRVAHCQDHTINLLANHNDIGKRVWDGQTTDSQQIVRSSLEDTETDSAGEFWPELIYCPICNSKNCKHTELLGRLVDASQTSNIVYCPIVDHADTELKFFCKVCWIPVCGDCSYKGDHKLHECTDMSKFGQEFIAKSLETLKEKLHILTTMVRQDVIELKNVETKFHEHIDNTDKELNSRKLKVMEETEHAFNKAQRDAELQGQDILMDHRDHLEMLMRYECFMRKISEVAESFATDQQQSTAQFVRSLLCGKLISLAYEKYGELKLPAERRLVLPQMEAVPTLPLFLFKIGTEWKDMKLLFSIKLKDEFTKIRSIILTGGNTCLLSAKRSVHDDSDAIVKCIVKETGQPDYEVYCTDPGDYFISQLASGEIVASYTARNVKSTDYEPKYAVYYISSLPAKKDRKLEFKLIKSFQFPPYGIAVTKENNILLCMDAAKQKSEGLCYLMLMSLRGKELKSTMKEGPDMISPNYVAVSDSGEICVSDTEGSSIVILDQNLDIKERMQYNLVTSFSKRTMEHLEALKFQPRGLCYDNYGRIIIADPDNNCVVRLVRAPGSHKYTMEPLLTGYGQITGFHQPSLVAIGQDSQLWVVCAEHIFVFDYCV